MRTFFVSWLVAFCAVALGAAGVGRLVASAPASAPSEPARPARTVELMDDLGPFRERDAVNLVSSRFPITGTGEQLRRELQGSATVSYHSPQHWRVCLEAACWVAHGPGRYAEPENDAAQGWEAWATTGQ
jgi:hypothetical protein